MGDFILGIKYALAGFGLITKPKIRRFVIVPLLINVVLFALVIVLGAHQLAELIDWIMIRWPWAQWLTWLLWPLFLIFILAVVYFAFSILANLIGAPFNALLSQAVEVYLTDRSDHADARIKNLPAEIKAVITSEARKILYFLTRAIPLLLLFIIPFALPLAPALWFLFGAWMLSLEYLDYPLGNKGRLFPAVREAAADNRAVSLGFGVGVMGMTLIPVINFIAMPVAVAGATKLTLERLGGR